MSALDPQILSVIVAGVISLLVSTLVAAWTQRTKLRSDYDSALRTERLAEYRKLWALTETLGWYGNHQISQKTAKKLLADFDRWYFETGSGLLMSNRSVNAYEELLLALNQFDGDVNSLRKLGTKLRYTLAYDVGGRNAPLLQRQSYKDDRAHDVLVANRGKQSDK
jgi:hypothetical protein